MQDNSSGKGGGTTGGRRACSGSRPWSQDFAGEVLDRRAVLRTMAARGLAIPAAYFMIDGGSIAGAHTRSSKPNGVQERALSTQDGSAAAPAPRTRIVRDFADPYIELVRLLREASEIEHALMVQYLYAAFSVKSDYQEIVGYGDPNTDDLLGVAIQEMQHLGKVNRFLTDLGAAPNLVRQDFPYEPDIYPFEFNLEPLGPVSLAKYAYTEAPPGSFDRSKANNPADHAFMDRIDAVLGARVMPNQIGSLYAAIIRMTEELMASSGQGGNVLRQWIRELEAIKDEGEQGHFTFFKDLFMGTHKGFKGRPNVWSLAPDHPAYPSLRVPRNPSAYLGHDRQIEDPSALGIAWLGNLHYWSILLLLDHAYRQGSPEYIGLAKQDMMGPFLSVARHLPTIGAGMPFDSLSMGYFPGRDAAHGLVFITRLLKEAEGLERELANRLPGDFPFSTGRDVLDQIADLQTTATAFSFLLPN